MRTFRFYSVLLATFILTLSCTPQKVWHIGVSQCSSDDWRRKMNEEMEREVMFHSGVSLEIRSADDSSEKQIEDLEYFMREGFDIIIAAPNEAHTLTPEVRKIYESGIPIIIFDRSINDSCYTAFQGADNREIGSHAARMAYSMLGKECRAIEICGLSGSSPAEDRAKGFDDMADELGFKILGRGEGKWNSDDGARVADSLLALYPSANLIYAHNDRMAIAASERARSAGRSMKVIGIDAAPSIGVRAVADSLIDATFLYPTEGHVLIRTALDILEGRPYKHQNIIPTPSAVDATNAEILLMQDRTLAEETDKIVAMKESIDYYWERHSMQTALLYGSLVIVVLLSFILFLLLHSHHSHIRHQKEMELRNEELNDLYEKLQSATSSKLNFFTNVSHDLRTPLTLISEPVRQLVDAENLNEDQRTMLRLADKNIGMLKRLVNQILDIRKFDNGKLGLNLVNADLGEFVREWAAAFGPATRKRHIRFLVDIATSDNLRTAVDLDKMERVLFNLLSNACKFTPENGSITLSMCSEEQNIALRVSDTGRGLSAEDAAHVFEQFFQADKVSSGGSGIGLALTKVFVEMHGGCISVESELGKGSCFTVMLPIRQVDVPEAEVHNMSVAMEGTAELAEIEIEDIRLDEKADIVLVIDDNSDMCTLLHEVLKDSYSVIQAHDGPTGIKLATKFVPQLVVSDVMMPGMDGFELCRRIKGESLTSHIPVLLLTAGKTDDRQTEGYECGADAFMGKPFDSRMLLARCRSLVENRKLVQGASQNGPSTALAEGVDDEFYARFATIVEANLDRSELSVEDIASELGLSRVQMYRKIKAITNYSPAEMMRNLRLKEAARLLKTTDMTISEIAYRVGFTAPSYFAKCYKDYYGETPSESQNRTSRIK